MGENLLVHLRVFQGKPTRDYDSGKINSVNHPMKLQYGVREWINTKETARYHFSKVIVEKVERITTTYKDTEYRDKKGDVVKEKIDVYKEIDTPDNITQDVAGWLSAPEKELSPQDKVIADMQKQIDALTTQGRGKTHKVKLDNTPLVDEERDAAVLRYQELHEGKKPHHATGLKKIIEDCEEKEAELNQ